MLVYLGGPILGCDYAGCTNWRDYTADKLPAHIQAISPMRGKEHLNNGGIIFEKNLENHPLCTPHGITTRGRFDVMRADALLMNFIGATKVSIGSIGEIFWANILRKPVVIAMEHDNIHNHVMVQSIAGFILPTLDEAIETAIAVLSTS